ncbi:toprim domain-containing protein [Aureimonas glaciei]|uniref:Toprim domain-containing protein n=1 Tax=Aureimonas glaciei TaxID=1776957 RepID=A0A916XY02_9HYPH|nr:toprim domain-containing protein [Aureimonas glaciei]GGD19939.1 hypothetical protein GCM10011335_23550 [Aureimonas glaciei]
MPVTKGDGDHVADFLDAMRSAGIRMDTAGGHPIADGKLHRANSLDPKRKGKKDIYYVLHLDHPASGHFGDFKLGIEDTWTAKRPTAMTAAERSILRERIDRERADRAEDTRIGYEMAAAAATTLMTASTKANPEHPYLARKSLPVFPGLRQLKENVRYQIHDKEKPNRTARAGTLIVPMFSPTGAIVGVQTIDDTGKKLFLKGTPKAGNYHSIGKAPEPGGRIFIAEGYATGARIHSATGALVIVAFDSGNLKSVAVAIRAKYPEADIIIAADNDRFTKTPVDNPGLTMAREAAKEIGVFVAVPHFDDASIEAGGAAPRDFSDFDDLFRLSGLEPVRAALAAAAAPNVVSFEAEKAKRAAPSDEPPPAMPDDYDPADREYGPAGGEDDTPHPLADFGQPHFRCLGIGKTTCYYQPSDVSEVIELSASSHKAENMMILAPLQWWEIEFPGKGKEGGVDWKAAVNACIRSCKSRGKFVSHNRVRGRGAWFEGEDSIFHAGDQLVINNEARRISHHHSRHVYDAGEPLDVDMDRPATQEVAREFLSICKSLRWSAPLSGYLLAGFCVVAPVCGFLTWRPHIWINGPAGAGKSTVMDKIVKRGLGTTAISIVGNTTEAGIRGALGMDALPVIFDEAEPRDMHSQARIRAILDLARVAASESDGVIMKGTSNQGTKGYRARSMFVFASINTQIEGYADETRYTQLTLAKPDADTPEQERANKEHYATLVSRMLTTIDATFARRMLARTIHHLPTLRHNVAIFTEAAAMHLGVQRLGDQLGPLLAGAYLLNSERKATLEEALKWISANDWADHSAKNAVKDQDRFVQHLSGHLVKHMTPEGGTWERTVGELIELSTHPDRVKIVGADGYDQVVDNKARKSAIAALVRLGIKVQMRQGAAVVYVSTSAEALKSRVLKGTEWAGTNIRTILKNIDGAVAHKGNHYFMAGINTPFVELPIEALVGERMPGDDV